MYYLFHFDIVIIHYLEKRRIQYTENSEKDNSVTKQKIREKRQVNKDKAKL